LAGRPSCWALAHILVVTSSYRFAQLFYSHYTGQYVLTSTPNEERNILFEQSFTACGGPGLFKMFVDWHS